LYIHSPHPLIFDFICPFRSTRTKKG
jgi:hypothetical protein